MAARICSQHSRLPWRVLQCALLCLLLSSAARGCGHGGHTLTETQQSVQKHLAHKELMHSLRLVRVCPAWVQGCCTQMCLLRQNADPHTSHGHPNDRRHAGKGIMVESQGMAAMRMCPAELYGKSTVPQLDC